MTNVDRLKIEARRAETAGDYARAGNLYLRAISASESEDALPDAGLLVRVADLECRQEDPEGALTYYRRAVEAYAEQGLLANAVAVCNKVLRVFPERHEYYARLAELHLDMGLTADARRFVLLLDEEAGEETDPDRILDSLRAFVGREPDEKVALRLASRLEGLDREEEAVEVLRDVWRARRREGLEGEALKSRAADLDADADLDAWARPPLEVHDGEETDGEGAASPQDGDDLGDLGVLGELCEERGSSHDGGRGPAADTRGGAADPAAGEGHIGVLQTLARLVEYRDFEAERHAERVGELAARLAEELGLSEGEAELIRDAAPLHDIGMVVVPDRVLLKESGLTPDEEKLMRTHASNGARILAESDLPVMRLASEIAHTHHERWDGEGYPRGLEGDEIPATGRIVAVADSFEALTHDRPFRGAESAARALEEIRGGSGAQFDPRVVDALVAVIGGDGDALDDDEDDGGRRRLARA
jgi:HD-GYP domain-containing protein (c-di-GMP phosphodiesterase class II)